VPLAAGAGVFTPRTYVNLSGKEARVLLLCTPAGFDRYFDRPAAEYAGLEPPEPSGPISEAPVVGPRIVAEASERGRG
jgi:hypothetical protein